MQKAFLDLFTNGSNERFDHNRFITACQRQSKMSTKAYDRTLASWAKEWREENLSPEVERLITQATYDLHFGPYPESPEQEEDDWKDWPGFSSACETIKDACEDMPRVLYIDTDCEYWQTSEPENEECCSCEGSGTYTEEDAGETFDCDACKGTGSVEPYWDCWYKAEKKDLLRAIVGKELAKYL